jgi:hypothetical protein
LKKHFFNVEYLSTAAFRNNCPFFILQNRQMTQSILKYIGSCFCDNFAKKKYGFSSAKIFSR